MAATEGRQRPDLPKQGPGPAHSPGAWIMEEPKTDTSPRSMTGKQAEILKDLAKEGRDHEAFHNNLSEEGAASRIRILRAKLAKDRSGKQHKPD